MRFLPSEHRDILQVLNDEAIDVREVLFVKRRGRLHVQLPGRADSFAFHRMRSTHLDQEGRWQEHETYSVGAALAKGDGIPWTEVLLRFRAWLHEA